MAIAYVGRAGSNTGNTRGAAVTVTTTAAIAAGDLIIVSVSAENVGDLNDLASVTDTAGNTYTSAKFTVDGGQNTLAAVWYCANCSALASGSTVTVTFNSQLLSSGESWEIAVDDVSGAATSTVTDGTNGHNSQVINATTTWDTNSITTTNAADLLWVAMGVNQGETAAITDAQSTPSSGWTMQSAILGGSNSHNSLRTAYQIVSSTGTYKGGGTATAFSNGVSAVIVAFKAATGGGGSTPLTASTAAAVATAGSSALTVAVALGASTAAAVASAGTAALSVAAHLTAATSAAIATAGSAALGVAVALTAATSAAVASAGASSLAVAVALTASTAAAVATAGAAALSFGNPLTAPTATAVATAGAAALTVAVALGASTATAQASAPNAALLVAVALTAATAAAIAVAGAASISGIAVPGTVTLSDALAATVTLADALAATVTLSDALAATVTLSDSPAEAA